MLKTDETVKACASQDCGETVTRNRLCGEIHEDTAIAATDPL